MNKALGIAWIWLASAAAMGAAVMWGGGGMGAQSQAQPHVLKVVGERHKLVLWSDGTVAGWGAKSAGQLGPVAAIPASRFGSKGLVAIRLEGRVVDVAAAYETSYAVMEDGTVMAWGGGMEGELGNGLEGTKRQVPERVPGSETPVQVSGLSGVVQVVAGGRTALALLKDGTVKAWGARGTGMLGDGSRPKRYGVGGQPALMPVAVPNVSGIRQLSAGDAHVLALTNDGRVLAWGSNYCGALGRAPRQELPMDEAAEVAGLSGVVAVAGGQGVSTVLKNDGTVWVWGSNWHSQFGNGERSDLPSMKSGWELTPRQVPGVVNVAAISVGITGRHTLALLKDGTLRGWGNTDWGQIGAGVSGQFQPRPVTPKIGGVKLIFAAGNNSFAVRQDNSLWAWGAGGSTEWPLPANTKLPLPLALK